MSDFRLQVFNELNVNRRMQMLALPPNKRRQILGGVGREIKRQSIRNLRAQKDVEGRPWAPRKRGNDRKLLRRINRQVAANILTGDFVEVSFRGAVAFEQQEGTTKVMTGALMQREQGGNENEPATRKQAKSLRDEGYKIRVVGTKKWRKPSLKWIQDNLSQKKAGLVLRHLRNQQPKTSWVTRVPGRAFLGATPAQINTIVNKVFDNTINSRV